MQLCLVILTVRPNTSVRRRLSSTGNTQTETPAILYYSFSEFFYLLLFYTIIYYSRPSLTGAALKDLMICTAAVANEEGHVLDNSHGGDLDLRTKSARDSSRDHAYYVILYFIIFCQIL